MVIIYIYLIVGAIIAAYDSWEDREYLSTEELWIVVCAQVILTLTWPRYFMGEE